MEAVKAGMSSLAEIAPAGLDGRLPGRAADAGDIGGDGDLGGTADGAEAGADGAGDGAAAEEETVEGEFKEV